MRRQEKPARPEWPADYLWCVGVGVFTDILSPIFYAPFIFLASGFNGSDVVKVFQAWGPSLPYQAVTTTVSLLAALLVARVLLWDPASFRGRMLGVALLSSVYQFSSVFAAFLFPSAFGYRGVNLIVLSNMFADASYGMLMQVAITAGLLYLLRRNLPTAGVGPGKQPPPPA